MSDQQFCETLPKGLVMNILTSVILQIKGSCLQVTRLSDTHLTSLWSAIMLMLDPVKMRAYPRNVCGSCSDLYACINSRAEPI